MTVVVIANGSRPKSTAGCWGGRLLWKLAFDQDQTGFFGGLLSDLNIRRMFMSWSYSTLVKVGF